MLGLFKRQGEALNRVGRLHSTHPTAATAHVSTGNAKNNEKDGPARSRASTIMLVSKPLEAQ